MRVSCVTSQTVSDTAFGATQLAIEVALPDTLRGVETAHEAPVAGVEHDRHVRHVGERARREGVPVIESSSIERATTELLDLVLARAESLAPTV